MILNHLVIFTELGWSWDSRDTAHALVVVQDLVLIPKLLDRVPYLLFGVVPPQVLEGHSSGGKPGVHPGRGKVGHWKTRGKKSENIGTCRCCKILMHSFIFGQRLASFPFLRFGGKFKNSAQHT